MPSELKSCILGMLVYQRMRADAGKVMTGWCLGWPAVMAIGVLTSTRGPRWGPGDIGSWG